MPIYEYKCRVCDEHFEVEQSFTEETLTEIDGCAIDASGRHQVKKVFAAPAISFKGDGFYRNDARSGAASTPSSTTPSSPDTPSTDKPTDSSSKSDSSSGASPSSNGDKAVTSGASSSNASSSTSTGD